MDLLEIVMLIIGASIVIVSSLLIHNPDKINDTKPNDDTAIKQYSESLSSVSEEIISRTEEYLSKLSNEKIMAVSEYSDQILEKIDRNHEEVVFLYNMLTHKENELKETLKELNDSQRRTKELLAKRQEDTAYEDMQVKSLSFNNAGNFNEDNNNSQAVSINNEEILNLYSQGMSILEISKKLGIGQGEVKLIVDLFSK